MCPLSDGYHPELFSKHVDGVRAELKQKDWNAGRDHRTLVPLLKILAPHKGLNAALALLPYYAEEYRHVVNLRNAIGHGDWEKLTALGGSEKAVAWAKSFYSLVAGCTQRGTPEQEMTAMAMRATLQLGHNRWPWPPK
jgi:hypothetical protein